MRKLFFVVNPVAGMRKAAKMLADIISEFNRGGYDVITYITADQGDAKKVVSQRAGEMDLIVCCGGDGTFNETVAGVMESGTDVPIGYIPAGSTNDYAGSLGLSNDPIKAAKQIVGGSIQSYDVGNFGGRYFTYVASFGAFTKASYATPQNIKNALGHTAYILGGIQELSQLRPVKICMEIGNDILKDEVLFGAVCNSTSLGGLFTLDPKQVDMQDGLFEVILVRAPKSLAEITECIQAVQQQKYNCKMITFCSAKKVTVETKPPVPWTLDGEREPARDRVEIENMHKAVRLIK